MSIESEARNRKNTHSRDSYVSQQAYNRGTAKTKEEPNFLSKMWSGLGGVFSSDNPLSTKGKDDVAGSGGMDAWGTGLQIAEIGLGVWDAFEKQKMNKFMRGYYGDQIKLQSADFSNSARSTNEALEQRRSRQLSANGIDMHSSQGEETLGNYMNKYGVDESPI